MIIEGKPERKKQKCQNNEISEQLETSKQSESSEQSETSETVAAARQLAVNPAVTGGVVASPFRKNEYTLSKVSDSQSWLQRLWSEFCSWLGKSGGGDRG